MTTVVVLLVLLCPVRHLVFALLLIICGMGLVVSILDSFEFGTSARLVVAAAGDGILCLVQGEVLREAGAAGDVLAAHFGLFLLAGLGGGFLPGLAFMAARRKFPKVSRYAAIGYAAMAVHSAVLLMQAIGTEMRFFLDGGGYIFDSPQCLYSTIDSPLSLVLNFLQSFATADEYQGPAGPAAPCPEDAEFVSSDPSIVPLVQIRSCTEMPLIALFFFLLLGARGLASCRLWSAIPTNREATRVKSGYEGEEPEHPDASEAVASLQMYVAVGVAMVGAAMFGFDQGNFGNVQAFETFRKEWCIGRYGDEESCSAEGSLDNDAWNDGFVTWGASAFIGLECFWGDGLQAWTEDFDPSHPRYYRFAVSDWYTGMLLPGLAGAVLTLGGFFIPESPRFVMEKMLHKESEAKAYAAGTRYLKRISGSRKTAGEFLYKLRSYGIIPLGFLILEMLSFYSVEVARPVWGYFLELDPTLALIMQQIKDEMDIEHVSFLGLFKERNLRKRVFIACCLAICQQATGVNAFLGYAATLFKECGIESPIMFNSIFNSIMIFGCIAGLLLVDSKYGGRRCQLLAATAIMGPPLILAGLALQFNWPGIITMACVVIYGVGFQFAWGTIPWIYPAEIFSMAEKDSRDSCSRVCSQGSDHLCIPEAAQPGVQESAVSLAIGFNYIANAAIIYITPALMKWSTPGTLLVFGALNVLNEFFVFLYIKETKGVPLEEVPDLFRRKPKHLGEDSSSDDVSDNSTYEYGLAVVFPRQEELSAKAGALDKKRAADFHGLQAPAGHDIMAFGAGLVHIGTVASTPNTRRVVPQGISDSKRRRGLAAGAFISIGLVMVIVLGVLGLECPYEAPRPVMPEEDNTEQPMNDSVSSSSSDMTTSTSTQPPSTTPNAMIDSNVSDGSNSSNDTGSRRLQSMDSGTNATNTTTQTTTTTPSPLLANFTAMEIQQAEEVMYTYHGAMMGQIVEMTGKCILPTGEEPSFVRFEEATDSDCPGPQIIGAGPHGLAMASRLILGDEAMADVIPPQESYIRRPKEVRAHLQKSRAQRSRNFAVVDSTGSWMERWRNQFDALAIPFLRSHEMMHPDAFDHSTLSVWAAAKSRNDFLFLENLPKDKAYHGPFVLPSNRMMLDFCRDLVKLGGLDKRIWPAHAESMRPSACGSGIEVSLRTAEDTLQTVLANHVVVARGPTWRRQWPAFYKLLDAAALAEIRHTWDLFDKPEQVAALRGRGIIVGGGLSSAHLCTQLAGRGHIDLLIRRERKVKQYDLGLSWMGWKRREQRREYEQASIEERLAKNRAARDGGSVSPELDAEVSQLEAKGLVTVHEWTEIATASFDGSWTVALSTGDVMEADYLICATGALVDAATDPLLSGLQEVHPLPMHGGLPAVTYNLQWGKLPVYLMGNLAALELGPDAVNMTGAARGALRISGAMVSTTAAAETEAMEPKE
eukprot:s2586_g13.t1